MAEAGGIIGCCLLLGCCGTCFFCGRGCKSDSSTEVREPQQQPARIVVTPVAVSQSAVQASAPGTPVPAGFLVMTDPVTGQQQLYAPVAPLTPTAAAPVIAASSSDTKEQTPVAPAPEATDTKRDDLKTPLLRD